MIRFWASQNPPVSFRIRRLIPVFLFFLLSVIIGCASTRTVKPIPEPISLQEAIFLYNQNVAAVPSFKAKISEWQVRIKSPDRSVNHKDIFGKVFFQPPAPGQTNASCYLTADSAFGSEIVIASNNTEFWFYIQRKDLAQWGKYEHAGKPCVREVPLNPQVFLEMLGLRPIPDSLGANPYPIYKILPEENVIEYAALTDSGLQLKREIFIDRRTNLPSKIYLYSEDGRRILESILDHYEPLGQAMLPGNITMTTPSGDFFFRLKLRQYKEDTTPRDALFDRTQHHGIKHFEQIDRRCESE